MQAMYLKNSNTTLVKVKYHIHKVHVCLDTIQIQHLLKLNPIPFTIALATVKIQIQHLLKLNSKLVAMETRIFKFKYNTC